MGRHFFIYFFFLNSVIVSESCLLVFVKYLAVHCCMALHILFRISTTFLFAFVWHEQSVLLEGKTKYTRTKRNDF